MTLCPSCTTPLPRTGAACPTCSLRPATGPSAPTRAAMLAGLLGIGAATGCTGAVALYGAPYTDEDGDGWAVEEGDCDDSDPAIHPEAEEVAGDGVDSNCDGFDDPQDGDTASA